MCQGPGRGLQLSWHHEGLCPASLRGPGWVGGVYGDGCFLPPALSGGHPLPAGEGDVPIQRSVVAYA